MKRLSLYAILLLCSIQHAVSQTNLVTNIHARKTMSLNGAWQYIVDPYETGYYDYRYRERRENDREAYWNSDVPDNKTDRKEHLFTDKYTLQVPGDWNSQHPRFEYYEGTVWYKRSFDYTAAPGNRLFLYFGAVNYKADVYLNGKKLGSHKGGFTPFNFEIPAGLVKPTGNFLVVKVDNTRHQDEVPTVNTDWWNYGGITRDVLLVETPAVFVQDYFLHLTKPEPGKKPAVKKAPVEGWVQLNGMQQGQNITIEIPELKVTKSFSATEAKTNVSLTLPAVQLWSPENPKLYTVTISTGTDKVTDRIGFRTIEAYGKQVLLNGEPLFMRGISVHEQIPQQARRATNTADALQLLGWARELGCNMVRLAHYPHNEYTVRAADSLGMLVWSEIPVYWTIDFKSQEVFEKARMQLAEMITRDRNRAGIIIWSVGNETPVSEVRTDFMHRLITAAKELDATRMVSAALEVNYHSGKNMNYIEDPLGEFVDIVSFNEYLGWYGGLPDDCRKANWGIKYNKPLFISETGGSASYGFHGDSLTRWSEEYQEWLYREQVAMLQRMPDNFAGISPWILADFRSPRRNNQVFQEGWNIKGLIDKQGRKKKAFFILQDYYRKK